MRKMKKNLNKKKEEDEEEEEKIINLSNSIKICEYLIEIT